MTPAKKPRPHPPPTYLMYGPFPYYTWKNVKKSNNNNRFKISGLTWNKNFELPYGSYSVSNIQDHFEYIIKKHEGLLIILRF